MKLGAYDGHNDRRIHGDYEHQCGRRPTNLGRAIHSCPKENPIVDVDQQLKWSRLRSRSALVVRKRRQESCQSIRRHPHHKQGEGLSATTQRSGSRIALGRMVMPILSSRSHKRHSQLGCKRPCILPLKKVIARPSPGPQRLRDARCRSALGGACWQVVMFGVGG